MAKAKKTTRVDGARTFIRVEPPDELSRLGADEAFEKNGYQVGLEACMAMAHEIRRLHKELTLANEGKPLPRKRVHQIDLSKFQP